MKTEDIIDYRRVDNLFELFVERKESSTNKRFMTWFDTDIMDWVELTYKDVYDNISIFHQALKKENLNKTDKVGIWIRNSPHWVFYDMAAFSLGLVTVPMYFDDRAENVAYTANDSNIKILLIEDELQLASLADLKDTLKEIKKIITLKNLKGKSIEGIEVVYYKDWIMGLESVVIEPEKVMPHDLATIVYTSGTTGNPKGVMLSHKNMLWNAWAGTEKIPVLTTDKFLSFLPLSHTFERTVGYYLPIMTGSEIVYSRSKYQVAGDIARHKPTILISVPRLFEKIYNAIKEQLKDKPAVISKLFDLTVDMGYKKFLYSQGRGKKSLSLLLHPVLDLIIGRKIRKKFGGHLRLTISGGAALSPELTKIFLGLNINLVQGYGMTELSPIVCVNTPTDNIPESVGTPLIDVQVKIGTNQELFIGGPGVMLGYFNNDKATKETIDSEGFLHTGDRAELKDGRIYIIGRLKEIIIMANGEKVPPLDIENALNISPSIDQSFVIGESKPFLSALIVLNEGYKKDLMAKYKYSRSDFETFARDENVNNEIIDAIALQMKSFPGYAVIRRVGIIEEPFDIENGFLTPTLKLKRGVIMEHYKDDIARLYEGH